MTRFCYFPNSFLASRALDSVLIIDRATGKIIFRWGSPSYLDKRTGRIEYTTGEETLGGPHAAVEIREGSPGAGRILCYDNGLYKFSSRVVELDPVSRQLVWQSGAPGMGRGHFSDFMGDAQRLPNGNTLICEGANGRFFQTTPQNQIVWEYVSPHVPNPILHGSVFRIHQYSQDYCPQFKKLLPAQGAAILPSREGSNDELEARARAAEQALQRSRDAMTNLIAGAIITAIIGGAVAFRLGQRSTRA